MSLHLTEARAPLTERILAYDERGLAQEVSIPAERPLTVYVDKAELVTLMTMGQHPEWLVLGYLRNQRLVRDLAELVSITVDWDVDAAAVRTRDGIADLAERTARKVVTTGCGQGSVFGSLMDDVDRIELPPTRVAQQRVHQIVEAMRLQESTYKSAGSVHGCALFVDGRMRVFVEDVGRHNAIDTIAGWMWLHDDASGDAERVFYTTGRLTSEMLIKAAQMRVPVVISRSGITQMGQAIAARLGLCAIGRALHQRYLCYAGRERLIGQGAEA